MKLQTVLVSLLAVASAHAQVRQVQTLRNGVLQTITEAAGTGTIRGRVFGPNGRPLLRAQVQLVVAESGRRVGFASTDEEGRYEFTTLAAEQYRVSAGRVGFLVMEYGQRRAFERGTPVILADAGTLDKIDITLPETGAITGRLTDENGDPVEGAMVQLLQVRFGQGRRQIVPVPGVAVRTSNDLGRYRLFGIPPGHYIVSAATNLTVSRNVTDGIPGYAASYAPGTPNAAEARTVVVDLSQEVGDVDVTFLPIATARITGKAVSSMGAPLHPNGTFVLSASQRSGALAPAPMQGNINSEGEFDIKNVAPGEYVLQVTGQRRRDEDEGEFSVRFITVNGRDIADLHIGTSAGSRLAGRVTYEGLSNGLMPADVVSLGSTEVTTVPIDLDRAPLGGHIARDSVSPLDPAFDLRGLTGPRLVRLARTPAEWSLKAVVVNGIDVTDTPLSFGTEAESLNDVEIILTRQVSEVSGRLADGRAQAVNGYVVAFSVDRDRWTPSSRFVKFARSERDGSFTVRGLPAGDYHVVAVDRLLEGIGEWQDPDFLESMAATATRITLSEGQKLSVSPRFIVR